MVTQIVGGIMSGSIAIFTTAAHLFFDNISFVVNMISIKIARKSPNLKFTYGYHRAEVIGALFSIVIIYIMVIWLFYEATKIILNGHSRKVNAPIMLAAAFVSVLCNLTNLATLVRFPCGASRS